jgi:signal transduction histidine kinase
MQIPILKVVIRYEQDLLLARRRARQIAQALDFSSQDQVRIATAMSELVRNVFQYTPGGRVEFSVEGGSGPVCSYGLPTLARGLPIWKTLWRGVTFPKPAWGSVLWAHSGCQTRFRLNPTPVALRLC